MAVLFFGMAGLRLDRWWRGGLFWGWLLVWLGCLVLFEWIFAEAGTRQEWALVYGAVVWTAYYGVMLSWVLGCGGRRFWWRRWGESKAYAIYEAVLGLVFLNQGLSQAALMRAYSGSWEGPVPEWGWGMLGGGLMVLGILWKGWATYWAGLDTYYYRDMFLGRATMREGSVAPVMCGPYRFTSNPMYGLGNLQAYGVAVWHGSLPGLLVAGFFQASVYAFYFCFERPFFRRHYKTL